MAVSLLQEYFGRKCALGNISLLLKSWEKYLRKAEGYYRALRNEKERERNLFSGNIITLNNAMIMRK